MTTKLAICSWVLNCLPPALHSWSRLVMIASAKTNCVLEPHRKAYFVCVCVCKFDSLAFPQYYLISAKRRKQLIGARPLCRAAHISRIKSFYDYQSTFREFQWERAMPITVQTNCQGNCQVCVWLSYRYRQSNWKGKKKQNETEIDWPAAEIANSIDALWAWRAEIVTWTVSAWRRVEHSL
jgi:hypothetical protein